MLAKAVNLQKKKNLWDKQAEELEKKRLDEQMQQEKRMANKLRNNPAFNGDENKPINNSTFNRPQGPQGPRKLTSLMSIFQQKNDEPVKPINKVVLNSAPVKKVIYLTLDNIAFLLFIY